MTVVPEPEQDEYESRRLWSKVNEAILANDMETATEEKSKVEDTQRMNVRGRMADGIEWVPRFFTRDGKAGIHVLRGVQQWVLDV